MKKDMQNKKSINLKKKDKDGGFKRKRKGLVQPERS